MLVRELFEELGVLHDGSWEERYLCFSPQERVFSHGEWHDGIEPEFALDAVGRAAFKQFDEEIARHRAMGEFTIPMAAGVRRESPLDRLSMADWLKQHRLDAPALRWYVDYACRDDYGALAAQTSAWAGIHYFASRAHDEQGPLTWPEGNGWIVKRLAAQLAPHIHVGEPAVRIERAGNRWRVRTEIATYLADAVIFAAPTFLVPYLVPELASRRSPLILFAMAHGKHHARPSASGAGPGRAVVMGQRHLRVAGAGLRGRHAPVAANTRGPFSVDILLVAR
mgnify:CR=1 FL=1